MVRVGLKQPLDLRRLQGKAGGGVGVRNDHRGPQAQIVLHVQGEVLPQGDDLVRHAPELCPYAVKAVGNVRVGQRGPFVAEGPHRKAEHLVAAVAGHHLGGLHSAAGGNGVDKAGAGGVGIKAQIPHGIGIHRLDHLRARRIGAFVGVQLDVAAVLGLLAGGIRFKRSKGAGKIAAHGYSPFCSSS